jgi:transcription antitermination factor NusG
MQTFLPVQQLSQRWYAIYVRSRHEKSVAAHFSLKSVEYFLPTYQEIHKWKNGCRMQLDLPLLPGYVFAKIVLSQRLCILECPGVIRFVGFNHELTPVEDCEIEGLRLGSQKHLVRPYPYLTAGTNVRVRRGPFEGRMGILVRDEGGIRVVISLDLLKRAIAVELDLADVDVVPSMPVQQTTKHCGHAPSNEPIAIYTDK